MWTRLAARQISKFSNRFARNKTRLSVLLYDAASYADANVVSLVLCFSLRSFHFCFYQNNYSKWIKKKAYMETFWSVNSSPYMHYLNLLDMREDKKWSIKLYELFPVSMHVSEWLARGVNSLVHIHCLSLYVLKLISIK